MNRKPCFLVSLGSCLLELLVTVVCKEQTRISPIRSPKPLLYTVIVLCFEYMGKAEVIGHHHPSFARYWARESRNIHGSVSALGHWHQPESWVGVFQSRGPLKAQGMCLCVIKGLYCSGSHKRILCSKLLHRGLLPRLCQYRLYLVWRCS